MKKLLSILILVLTVTSMMGQSPEKMSYQAVIRDAGDILLTSTTIGMQISILEGSPTGTAVYVETHTPTTNTNGLVSLIIGDGTIVLGDFSMLDWGTDSHYIKTETDPTGGTSYTIEGTSQLLSVPYALYSKNGGSGNTLDQAYDKEMTTGPTTRTINADDGKIEIIGTGNTALEIEADVADDGLVVINIGTEEGIDLSNTGDGDGVLIDNTGTGDGLKITNDSMGDAIDVASEGGGDAISIDNAGAGDALFIDNLDSTGSFAISVNNDGGSAAVDILNDGGGAGMLLTNDGGGDGFLITQDGAGDAMEIDNDGAGTGLKINNEDNTAGGDAFDIANDGGGDAVTIDNAGAGDAIFVDNTDSTGSFAISVNNDGGFAAVDILNDGGGDAISITNTGGGQGVAIAQTGAGNALNVMNGGTGVGVNIVNGNPVGMAKALTIFQAADEDAVFVDNSGIGKGVSIFNGNPFASEALEVIQTGVATALLVDNAGLGKGVHIFNGSLVNPDNALFATTMGTGGVAKFMTDDNNANTDPTVFAENFGAGSAGVFLVVDEFAGKVNMDPAVNISSNGKGAGLSIGLTNDVVIGGDVNTEPAILVRHEGQGHVGFFETTSVLNLEHTLEVINHGGGHALHLDSFGSAVLGVNATLYAEQANSSILSSEGQTAIFDLHPAGTSAAEAVLIRSAATSGSHAALRVLAATPAFKAAVFSGDVDITSDLVVGGSFSAAAKAFKIDHPLDPENKFLIHNSIESNERINMYNGNITTDDEGYATVQLPEYMNALNKDFKYQLTIVDKSFAQAIIWEPMNVGNNSFVIKTNAPEIQVSWQITGTRQDTWAKNNPMQVEVNKDTGL